MIALALLLAAGSVPGTDYVLACTAKAEGDKPAEQFLFSFTADGTKIGRIAVNDPKMVLDPQGNLPVFEYSGGRMTRSTPPRPKLRFSGTMGAKGAFVFASADRIMSITLTLTPRGDGSFAYSFTGWRMMDSTLRADLGGEGSCAAGKGAP